MQWALKVLARLGQENEAKRTLQGVLRLMFGWMRKLTPVTNEISYTVSIDTQPATEPVLNDEMRASISSLIHHPGFNYLLHRARYVKAYLKRQLEEGRHDNLNQVNYLQAGIYWASFWEREMLSKSQPVKPPAVATDFEREAFETARAALDVVCLEDATSV